MCKCVCVCEIARVFFPMEKQSNVRQTNRYVQIDNQAVPRVKKKYLYNLFFKTFTLKFYEMKELVFKFIPLLFHKSHW